MGQLVGVGWGNRALRVVEITHHGWHEDIASVQGALGVVGVHWVVWGLAKHWGGDLRCSC